MFYSFAFKIHSFKDKIFSHLVELYFVLDEVHVLFSYK